MVAKWLLALACAGCSIDAGSRCHDAAVALSSCHGIDAVAFEEACAAASSTDQALVDEVLASDTNCPTADGKADGVGETAFVVQCRGVLAAAHLLNAARNPDSVPLIEKVKAPLREYFGTTVDYVEVHWSATLPDDWPLFHIEDAFMDVGAQTFGLDIFAAYPGTNGPLNMLVHELTHVKQLERFGSLSNFMTEYCRGFYRSDLHYDKNPLEVEAYDEEARIVTCLTYGC